MTEIPIIETERLRLRAFGNGDHPAFAEIYTDEATAKYIGGVCDADTAWRMMAVFSGHWNLRGYGPFAVALKDSDELAGFTGPWYPSGKPEHEIQWSLRHKFHGRGFATEAARAAIAWTYQTQGFPTLVSYISPENPASRRVAERLGAQPGGQVELRGWTMDVLRHKPPETFL